MFNSTAAFGFDGILIVGVTHMNLSAKCISNYPTEFVTEYRSKQLHHLDASQQQYHTLPSPISWHQAFVSAGSQPHSRCPYTLSKAHGMPHIMAVPVYHPRGAGVVNFSFKGTEAEFHALWKNKGMESLGFSQLIFGSLATHYPDALFYQPRLTPREAECLSFISKGLNNNEASCLMGVSRDRVKELVSNLIRKLDASNRTEAVMIASKNCLI